MLIYLVIVVGGGAVIATAAQMMFRPHLGGRMTGWILLWEELIGFALVFGGAIVMSRIERRPAGEYGLPASEMFDWGETFLFGAEQRGDHAHLSNAVLQDGPKWLAGGTMGPEGSVFCFLGGDVAFPGQAR